MAEAILAENLSPVLPALEEPYPVPPGAAEQYRKNGSVILRGVASPEEVAAYRPSIVETTRRMNAEQRPLDERDTYGKAFLQTMNLWTQDERVKRFTLAKRFARVAAELMGVRGVRIYHDQSLFKEPNGGHTPWHQDQFYWPLDTANTITMWMPLTDVTEDMGIMRFADGSHAQGYLEALPIGDESEEKLAKFVSDRGYPISGATAMRAGDASFHSGWTLHAAPANRSNKMREVMTVIYFADGARVTEPDNPGRQLDLYMWLQGLNPGDLAASETNPLVYSAQ